MSQKREEGVLGVFAEIDAAVEAIERLKAAGMHRIETFSPAEIALATALGAPIVLAIESARRRLADRHPARQGDRAGHRRRGGNGARRTG